MSGCVLPPPVTLTDCGPERGSTGRGWSGQTQTDFRCSRSLQLSVLSYYLTSTLLGLAHPGFQELMLILLIRQVLSKYLLFFLLHKA